jgi:hypothetical protein
VFRTVYVLGHPTLGPRALIRAAALACPGAVISHRSAATLLGLREVAPAVVDLIPPIEHGRRIDGIKAHRVPYPGRSEARRAAGLPMPPAMEFSASPGAKRKRNPTPCSP